MYRIHVKRHRYKFSCAHMTVFPGGRKERLHGHNYYVSMTLELADISFDKMIDFEPIKSALADLCASWKEHTMIALHNPYFEIKERSESEIEFNLCGKRYVLPLEDVLLLPIDNVAVEPLSAHAADLLYQRLESVLRADTVRAFEVTIEENPGQGATTRREITPG
jgi:6-pyruvoyltetrahydropterin/6-carboxytetrahydropterin synthase